MSIRRQISPLAKPGALALLASLLVCLHPANAAADLIRGSSDPSGVAPDEGFEDDCLGDTLADDCDLRAALMEGELVSVLAHLEDDTAPETKPLFESALELDDPVLRDMALRYVSRSSDPPQSFFDAAKTFFFGADAPLAARAAGVLESSPDQSDRDASDTFAELRSASDYAFPDALTPDEHNLLLTASVTDARFDSMQSFAPEEVFEPAERLLMYDRLIRFLPPPEADYPITAFMTDASTDEAAAFFTDLFGKPLGTYAEAKEDYKQLTLELAPLQTAAASGDRDALAQLMALSSRIKQAQDLLTLGALLNLENIHAENDQLWLDGTAQDFFHTPRRTVLVGRDEALDKTVIRYVNADPAPAASAPGRDGEGGAVSDTEDSPGAGGANDDATTAESGSGSSGCDCSIPKRSRPAAPLTALALLALCTRRARRRSAPFRPARTGIARARERPRPPS